jgi:hypothetical protein
MTQKLLSLTAVKNRDDFNSTKVAPNSWLSSKYISNYFFLTISFPFHHFQRISFLVGNLEDKILNCETTTLNFSERWNHKSENFFVMKWKSSLFFVCEKFKSLIRMEEFKKNCKVFLNIFTFWRIPFFFYFWLLFLILNSSIAHMWIFYTHVWIFQ